MHKRRFGKNSQYNPARLLTALMASTILAISGCSNSTSINNVDDSGSGGSDTSIGGGGVKGPMANADVIIYAFDATQPGFKGSQIETGTTNAQAQITGLSRPAPENPPYIIEFTTNAVTTDLTTGVAPVITILRSVITQALLDGGEEIYATPLTTMAVDLAVVNADSNVAPWAGNNDGTTSATEFVVALDVAADQVVSTVGFGMDGDIDIFDTPPLIDATTDTVEEQGNVAQYRAAIEALTAVVFQMQQAANNASDVNIDVDAVLAELVLDLAVDGEINGEVSDGSGGVVQSDVIGTTALDVLKQDPETLPIPNAEINPDTGIPYTVADIEDLLANETDDTGSTIDTTNLEDGTIETVTQPAATDPDLDDDGTLNADDAFPENPAEVTDSDGDGIGNNADTDDDNDGVVDSQDAFPNDPSEHVDTDLDGLGNNVDTDDDGDGIADTDDDFPLDSTRSDATDADADGWPEEQDPDDNDASNPGTAFVDSDDDGEGDTTDTDDDNDGVGDAEDDFDTDPTETRDTDGDGIGDNTDTDIDSDGVNNSDDAFPYNPEENRDTDNDGIGDNADLDDDNDGLSDAEEGEADIDQDGIPNSRDIDSDGDGYLDESDSAPYDPEIGINYAPSVIDQSVLTDEDTPVSITLSVSDDYDAATSLIYAIQTLPQNGILSDDSSQTFTYTPDENFSGTDTVVFVVIDSFEVVSAPLTISITVTPINDAPVIDGPAELTVLMDEDGIPAQFSLEQLSAADVEQDTLGWSISSAATTGQADVDATGIVSYIPNANAFGFDSFTIEVSDGNGGADTIIVNVIIQSHNDAPEITQGENAAVVMSEDGVPTPFNLQLGATDIDQNTLDWSISSAATSGQASVDTTGAVSYIPYDSVFGSDSFTVEVSDDAGGKDSITINVTIESVNDAPEITGSDPLSVLMETPLDIIFADLQIKDVDNTDPADFTLLVQDGANYQRLGNTITPDTGFTGVLTVPVVVSDGALDSAEFNITVEVYEETADISGVWRFHVTTDSAVPQSGTCDAGSIGQSESTYITITQNGDALEVRPITNGDIILTGMVQGSTFNFAGTESFADPDGIVWGDDTVFTNGQAGVSGLSGTFTRMETQVAPLQQNECLYTMSYIAEFVYKHDGSEDYNGVYVIESMIDSQGSIGGNPERESSVVQFEIIGEMINLFEAGVEPSSLVESSFNSDNGWFTLTFSNEHHYDSDGDTVDDSVLIEDHRVQGIFVRDSLDVSGLPIMAYAKSGFNARFEGTLMPDGAPPSEVEYETGKGYAKLVHPEPFTQVIRTEDGITHNKLGIRHPPLQAASFASRAVQVLVSDGTSEMCQGNFLTDVAYTEVNTVPYADMAAEAFQPGAYSQVSCDAGGSVADGATYIVNILADGNIIASYPLVAEVPPVPVQSMERVSIDINGAGYRSDMSGDLHGYFNPHQPLPISWALLNDAPAEYQVRIQEANSPEDMIYQTRLIANAPYAIIEPETFDEMDLVRIRTTAKYDHQPGVALANSDKISVRGGINGLFDINLIGDGPLQFQLDIASKGANITECMVIAVPGLSCTGGSIDFMTNKVSLYLEDGGSFTVIVQFSDSAYGVVTDTPGIQGAIEVAGGEFVFTGSPVAMSTIFSAPENTQW